MKPWAVCVKWGEFRTLGALARGRGNFCALGDVLLQVSARPPRIVPLLVVVALSAAADDYSSIQKKLDLVESDKLKAGSRVELSVAELNAYAAHELPAGVRNPRLGIPAPGIATGSALVDFGKLQRARGSQPGWLMSMLLNGERPVTVTVSIRSSRGQAVVDVQRVGISGFEIEGATLDFLIHNILLPLYPNAVVGQPFELGHRIEKLDVQTRGVTAIIGR